MRNFIFNFILFLSMLIFTNVSLAGPDYGDDSCEVSVTPISNLSSTPVDLVADGVIISIQDETFIKKDVPKVEEAKSKAEASSSSTEHNANVIVKNDSPASREAFLCSKSSPKATMCGMGFK